MLDRVVLGSDKMCLGFIDFVRDFNDSIAKVCIRTYRPYMYRAWSTSFMVLGSRFIK